MDLLICKRGDEADIAHVLGNVPNSRTPQLVGLATLMRRLLLVRRRIRVAGCERDSSTECSRPRLDSRPRPHRRNLIDCHHAQQHGVCADIVRSGRILLAWSHLLSTPLRPLAECAARLLRVRCGVPILHAPLNNTRFESYEAYELLIYHAMRRVVRVDCCRRSPEVRYVESNRISYTNVKDDDSTLEKVRYYAVLSSEHNCIV